MKVGVAYTVVDYCSVLKSIIAYGEFVQASRKWRTHSLLQRLTKALVLYKRQNHKGMDCAEKQFQD